jgi:hypothetical protein
MARLAEGTRLRSRDRREPLRTVEIVGHTRNSYTIRTVVDTQGHEVVNGRRSRVRAANLLKLYEPLENGRDRL